MSTPPDDTAVFTLTLDHLPLLVHLYDMDAFPGRDSPLWTDRIEGEATIDMPDFGRSVRLVLVSLGNGKVQAYPPLPTMLQPDSAPGLPPFTMAAPNATFPITIELFAVADHEGQRPLWRHVYGRHDIIAPPPWRTYRPCWTRITNGAGKAWIMDEFGIGIDKLFEE